MTINQDIVVAAQFSTDGKAFKRDGNTHTAWDSATEFLTANPYAIRHNAMVAWVTNGDNIELWHFVGGIADEFFVKFSLPTVTSIVTEISSDDFPDIGTEDVIYIDTTEKKFYIWDGASYQEAGSPGPLGPKGNKGDKGDTGDTGPQGDKGDTGEAGEAGPQITLRVNDVDNGEQELLNFVDSPTVTVQYKATGKVQFNSRSGGGGILRFTIGDDDWPDAGDTEITNINLIGLAVDNFAIWREGIAMHPDDYTFDSETGTLALVGDDELGEGERFLIIFMPLIESES